LITKQLVCVTVTLVWVASSAPAQETDPLQQQLQQLKQQYTDTTRELELRITTLEHQIEERKVINAKTQEGTVSTVELAAQEAARKAGPGQSNQVGATFQGQLPSETDIRLPERGRSKGREAAGRSEQL